VIGRVRQRLEVGPNLVAPAREIRLAGHRRCSRSDVQQLPRRRRAQIRSQLSCRSSGSRASRRATREEDGGTLTRRWQTAAPRTGRARGRLRPPPRGTSSCRTRRWTCVRSAPPSGLVGRRAVAASRTQRAGTPVAPRASSPRRRRCIGERRPGSLSGLAGVIPAKRDKPLRARRPNAGPTPTDIATRRPLHRHLSTGVLTDDWSDWLQHRRQFV
jgi:hypothetical protein